MKHLYYSYMILNSWVPHLRPNYKGFWIFPPCFDGFNPQNTFHCETSLHVESVRYAGHTTDISIPTISLFGGEEYGGSMTQYSVNVSDYAGTFSSLLITPPGTATFYTQPNYGGHSICLQPKIETGIHWSYSLKRYLGVEPGGIKSFHFGCNSSNVEIPDPKSKSRIGC